MNAKIYNLVDTADYICFGIALCTNIQGLLISPVLLKKDWKRNIVVVLANACYLISNLVNFGQKGIQDCLLSGYLIQLFMIFGSILEVHTPIVRAFPLFNAKLKKIVPIASFIMILCQFLVLVDFHVECDSISKRFLSLHSAAPAQFVANIFSIFILFVAFSKIIELIDKSEFAKNNSKMQLIRTLSKYSLYFAISVKVGHTVLDATNFGNSSRLLSDGAITIALRSNLVVFLMISQFTLELTKQAGDQSTHSDSNSKHEKSFGTTSGGHVSKLSEKSKNAANNQKRQSFRENKKAEHSIVEVEDD
eukprot:NODE_24_length_41419_cov_0.818780.p13 type:complete len:306 gc:universal NODE_24_length_41419_cov_0.818780:27620-28537(+)